jgi:hypothetical protein
MVYSDDTLRMTAPIPRTFSLWQGVMKADSAFHPCLFLLLNFPILLSFPPPLIML